MKEKIKEQKNNTPPEQISLDLRTDKELVRDIREKRARGISLDKKEEEFVRKQEEEDREDIGDLYPH